MLSWEQVTGQENKGNPMEDEAQGPAIAAEQVEQVAEADDEEEPYANKVETISKNGRIQLNSLMQRMATCALTFAAHVCAAHYVAMQSRAGRGGHALVVSCSRARCGPRSCNLARAALTWPRPRLSALRRPRRQPAAKVPAATPVSHGCEVSLDWRWRLEGECWWGMSPDF